MSTKPVTVTYLTFLGKGDPAASRIFEGTILDHEGERFVVDQVLRLAGGGWQANAVPARIWRHFERV